MIPSASASGDLVPLLPAQQDSLHVLVRMAHAHHVKVFISIGGWNIGDGGGVAIRFKDLAGSADSRTNFTHSVMHVVRNFDLDGADIDWEYPNDDPEDRTNFTLIMKQLQDSLHRDKKQLSAAIISFRDMYGQGIEKAAFRYVDWFNIMAYDDDYTHPDGSYHPHSLYSLADSVFDYWVNKRDMPKSKAILGIPFYGKGPGKFASYQQLLAMGADPREDVYNGIYYNGISTVQKKTKLARQRGGGVMIWELPQDVADDHSLLKAIYEASE